MFHIQSFPELLSYVCNQMPFLAIQLLTFITVFIFWLVESAVYKLRGKAITPLLPQFGYGALLGVVAFVLLMFMAIFGGFLEIMLSGPYYSGPSSADITPIVFIVSLLAGVGAWAIKDIPTQ